MASAAMLVFLVNPTLAQAPKAPGGPAAVVNGEPISVGEVETVLKLMPTPPTPPTDVQLRVMRREALEMLISDLLLRQFLTKNGRALQPAEIEKQITELQAALKSQNHTLQEFLKDTAQSEAHLRLDIAKKLQWDDYVKKQATEANLHHYYEQNKDYYDRVTVRASHILFRVSPTASEGDYLAAQQKLQGLRGKIVAGQIDFAKAAHDFSQCDSAPRGGDIGYFPRKWVVDEKVAKTAFGMKVGDLSDVIRTEYGCHLIKVTDRKPGQPSTYESMKDEVRENYAMEMRENILAQERKGAKIEIGLP
jgi:parvulin-like peptidyl-prolyl isomerase